MQKTYEFYFAEPDQWHFYKYLVRYETKCCPITASMRIIACNEDTIIIRFEADTDEFINQAKEFEFTEGYFARAKIKLTHQLFPFGNWSPTTWAEAVWSVCKRDGLTLANQANHDALDVGGITYAHFKAGAERLMEYMLEP